MENQTWEDAYNRVYSFLARRLDNRSTIEDMTAEVLEEFFLNTPESKQHKGYLYGIARNHLNLHLRKKYQEQSKHYTVAEGNNYSLHHKTFLVHLLNCIRKNLKDVDLKIVEMCVQYDFASLEVAKELDLSPDLVRQRLKRSLSKLREKCKDYWAPHDKTKDESNPLSQTIQL
jgi:RNA polymerase sigma factor (sigma-70 family)